MFHVRLDRQREEQQADNEDAQVPPQMSSTDGQVGSPRQEGDDNENQPDAAAQWAPYFPLGLAVSTEQPTDFNFDLFLFDTLHLPRGLFPEDNSGPVRFANVRECRDYCQRFITHQEEQNPRTASREDLSRQSRGHLDKAAIFQESGQALGSKMYTGNLLFDANIRDLRLDHFGNVMFLHAPTWSDISAQLTHGYPRRLIRQPHAGILRGNLTVAAKISNQAIRSLSCGDVAAFLSRGMVAGLGLTVSELMLARTSAIKYAGKRDKPARLLDLMLRYGIDFLTITPLSTEQVNGLRETSSRHWDNVLSLPQPSDSEASTGESDDSIEGEATETELSLSWEPTAECGGDMPNPSSSNYHTRVLYHVSHLFVSYLTPANADTEREPTPPNPTGASVSRSGRPRSSGRSGRRRKRATPETPAVEADDTPQEPANNSQEQHDAEDTASPDARAILLALPNLTTSRIPTAASIARLTEFLAMNQPTLPQLAPPSSAREAAILTSLRRTQQSFRLVRTEGVRQALQDLWRTCKVDCLCVGRPTTRSSSQESRREENCPYCLAEEDGSEVSSATYDCMNENCPICLLVNKCELGRLVELGAEKNNRLIIMLEMSQHIGFRLHAEDATSEQRDAILAALCRLLCCSITRVRNIASVGYLTQVCPNLLHLQLTKGWGNFWNEMSKFGNAIGYQRDERNRLAVLLFLRSTCIPDPESPWHYFLQSVDNERENELRRTIFPRCWTREQGEENSSRD